MLPLPERPAAAGGAAAGAPHADAFALSSKYDLVANLVRVRVRGCGCGYGSVWGCKCPTKSE
mgnify:CR=1 FL=1